MASGGKRIEERTQGLLSYFARHPTAANLVMVLMLISGILVFPLMRTQFFPDVVIDTVQVGVSWSGAGAEDVDAAIVQVLEPALLAVEGVTGSDSSAAEGRATIRLEFEPGYDMERATRDVQLAVDAVGTLPDGSDDPTVRRGGWSDRVTDVVISGPVGVDQLGRFADELAGRLFAAGVTRATIQGVAAPSTIVEVPSLSLIQHDIGLSDISDAIAREVNADPAGEVNGTARVRTGTPKRSADEIGAIILRQNPDGSHLTISDVASITTLGVDRDRALYVGDNPAVQIRVDRNAQGDAVGLQATVEDVVREYQATMPAGVTVDLVNAQAEQISGRIDLMLSNGTSGLILVVIMLFLFLNARTAFWVSMGIPIAMLSAIAMMYVFGFTLNMMSLFALILTLGVIVDDSIVVGEHAEFRMQRLGESQIEAAENASRRMILPVLSATVTTIIAFFGLLSIGGRFGDLIADIPYTVIFVMVVSLVECFFILPHHLGHSGFLSRPGAWYDWPSRTVNRGFNWFAFTLFRPFVRFITWARYPVVAAAVVLLAWQLALVIRGDVPWRFFSSPEQGSVSGNFAMLPAATREDSLAMMREMQRATAELAAEYEERDGTNPVIYAVAEIGGNSGRAIAGSESKESWQLGGITIQLVDADLRPYSSGEFVTALQERIRPLPMAETVSFRSWGSGPGGDAIDIQLFGADSAILKEAAETLKAALAQYPEVSALEDTLAYDKDEMILELTPQGQALGFTIDALGADLRSRLGGIEAATYPDGARSATIRVELPDDELTADFLSRTMMRSPDGAYLPLGDIVTVTRQTGFSTLRRENGVMLISVTGALADDDPDRASAILQSVADDILPQIESDFGVGTALSGLSEQEDEFLNDAVNGLILCLAGIFLVLAWIFGSWTRPLVVMSVIPFGLIGAVWGHAVWGIPMSLFTVVGLLGMVGIIINDSIVLVSTVDEYSENRGVIPAIIDSCTDRLRPIFLTTATTLLGLGPMLFEGSSQAEFLKPTVVTLVYGLGFGMVIVLVLVPTILAIQSDIGKQTRAARRALQRGGIGAGWPAWTATVAALALFGALILPVVLTGAGWSALAAVLPVLSGGIGPALTVYAGVLAVIVLLIYAVAALSIVARRRASA